MSKKEALEDKTYPSLLFERTFILNSSEQILSYRRWDDYYLVQLVSSRPQKEKFVETVKVDEMKQKKQVYLDSFIASLLRVATIEKNEDVLHEGVNASL